MARRKFALSASTTIWKAMVENGHQWLVNDLAVLDLGKAHMIAVDGNTDVVFLIQPLLSSQTGGCISIDDHWSPQ